MTQTELAARMGRPLKTVNEIIKGKAAITPETALQLERVLGAPAHFWLTREKHYREYLERLADRRRLQRQVPWLEELPLAFLRRLGFVSRSRDKLRLVGECLSFFGVASVEAWERWLGRSAAAFRSSEKFAKGRGAVAVWLRLAEIKAQKVETDPFSAATLRAALPALRSLTRETDPQVFQKELQAICARAGIVVVFVPRPPKCPLWALTRWLRPDRALVVVSLRYKTNDHLWFSLFHELGHILKHGKRLQFPEGDGIGGLDPAKEQEADAFARDCLIPPEQWRSFTRAPREFSREEVLAFARRVGVAPAIVVGRLQREKRLPYHMLNDLRVSYEWAVPLHGQRESGGSQVASAGGWSLQLAPDRAA
jgi:plasmid maintenance system antidote protein VapI